MFVIYGWYKWGRKFVGYKKDLCHRCKIKTIWHRMRFFPVVHIFWVPLIPLGMYKEWICDQCRQSPKTSFSMVGVIALGVAGAVFSFISLFALSAGFKGDRESLQIGAIMFCISLVFWGGMILAVRHSNKQKLLRQAAFEKEDSMLNEPCLYCNGEIQRQYKPVCIDCGARVYETIDEFADIKTDFTNIAG